MIRWELIKTTCPSILEQDTEPQSWSRCAGGTLCGSFCHQWGSCDVLLAHPGWILPSPREGTGFGPSKPHNPLGGKSGNIPRSSQTSGKKMERNRVDKARFDEVLNCQSKERVWWRRKFVWSRDFSSMMQLVRVEWVAEMLGWCCWRYGAGCHQQSSGTEIHDSRLCGQ